MTESNNKDKQAQSASYFALSVRRYTENRTKEECSRTVPETEALLMLRIAMAASAQIPDSNKTILIPLLVLNNVNS